MVKRQFRKNGFSGKEGYTLIEVMIVVAILAILALVMAPALHQLSNNMKKAESNIRRQESVRHATRNVKTFLGQALKSTVSISQEVDAPPYSRVDFTTASGEQMAIYQSGTSLIEAKGPGLAQKYTILKRGLKRITFAYPDIHDERALQVSMTALDSEEWKQTKEMGYTSNLVFLEH